MDIVAKSDTRLPPSQKEGSLEYFSVFYCIRYFFKYFINIT